MKMTNRFLLVSTFLGCYWRKHSSLLRPHRQHERLQKDFSHFQWLIYIKVSMGPLMHNPRRCNSTSLLAKQISFIRFLIPPDFFIFSHPFFSKERCESVFYFVGLKSGKCDCSSPTTECPILPPSFKINVVFAPFFSGNFCKLPKTCSESSLY